MTKMIYRKAPSMDLPSNKDVEQLIGNISIAAVRSWLKQKGVPSSAGSRDALVARVLTLFEKKRLSVPELQAAAIEMEESSSKRVMLFDISDEAADDKYRDIEKRAKQMSSSYSEQRRLAPTHPKDPSLIYLSHNEGELRAKFAETQQEFDIDLKRRTVKPIPVTKVVVAVSRPKTGVLQIRFDAPGDLHTHLDERGRPNTGNYHAFYLERIGKLLGHNLRPLDLRPILKKLAGISPRPFQISLNRIRNPADSRIRISNPGDVRDDPDWQAAQASGGAHWAHEEGAGEWLAEVSGGKLNRDIFTAINALRGTLRFLADCHEGELEYVVSKIEELYRC